MSRASLIGAAAGGATLKNTTLCPLCRNRFENTIGFWKPHDINNYNVDINSMNVTQKDTNTEDLHFKIEGSGAPDWLAVR